MSRPLTFLDTARAIASADGMPETLVPTLVRRIRIFDTKNLIPVLRTDTGRREGRLDLVGGCMARVHSELIDFGVDAVTLRGLLEFLNRRASLESNETQFAAAVRAVQDKKAVTLALELWQRPDPWAKGHQFCLEGHAEKSARVTAAIALRDQSEGIEVRARLVLDLSKILSPFLSTFAAISQTED